MPVPRWRTRYCTERQRPLLGGRWTGIISPRLLLSRANHKALSNPAKTAMSKRASSNNGSATQHTRVEVTVKWREVSARRWPQFESGCFAVVVPDRTRPSLPLCVRAVALPWGGTADFRTVGFEQQSPDSDEIAASSLGWALGVVGGSEATVDVVVDHADVLHEGVHARGPHEAVSL